MKGGTNASSHDKARAIVEAALERKAEDPVALDVRALTSFTESFVIVTGGSDRQVRGIADSISKAMKALGDAPLGVEGLDDGHWVLIDCNDVICHVFERDTREHYDLERLWADGEAIDVSDLSVPADDSGPTLVGVGNP